MAQSSGDIFRIHPDATGRGEITEDEYVRVNMCTFSSMKSDFYPRPRLEVTPANERNTFYLHWLVELIGNKKTAYGAEMEQLVDRWQLNNLSPNVDETKEMVVGNHCALLITAPCTAPL